MRLNFSHGTHEWHLKKIQDIRKWSNDNNQHIGIIADLQGPKIRITDVENSRATLKEGQQVIIDANEITSNNQIISIDAPRVLQDLNVGDILVIGDGLIQLQVQEIRQHQAHCLVKHGGLITSQQGINKLGGWSSLDFFTDKDKKDLTFALNNQVDYIAVSFVSSKYDLEIINNIIQNKKSTAKVIAKIENIKAIENLDEIIKNSHATMVARGDLGIAIGIEQVPSMQKYIIERTRALNKAVITATQMMESMKEQATPTRAEVSDIANAILDNTDAIMFSAETASGNHPTKVVNTAHKICLSSETNPLTSTSLHRIENRFTQIDEAIAMGAMYIANHQDISAIIAFTETGSTPLWMSRIKSNIPIYGLSPHLHAIRAMNLYRNVHPILFESMHFNAAKVNHQAILLLKQQKLINKGELVIITQGNLLEIPDKTNSLQIEHVF